MKHLKIFLSVVLLTGLSVVVTSCSKNDDPEIATPSRFIRSVDLFFGSGDVYERMSTIRFTYDGTKLVKAEADKLLTEVTYTYYSADSLSYSEVKSADGTTKWNKTYAKLREGRIKTCHSSEFGLVTYSYDNNFISSVTVGGSTVLEYDWGKDNLKITSSGLPDKGYYNTSYSLSETANDYSIDLNVLSQLVDGRENYTAVMNTYGQMIGVLGARSNYLLENTNYVYDYEYDQDGRVSSVTLMPRNSNSLSGSYSFKIKYAN